MSATMTGQLFSLYSISALIGLICGCVTAQHEQNKISISFNEDSVAEILLCKLKMGSFGMFADDISTNDFNQECWLEPIMSIKDKNIIRNVYKSLLSATHTDDDKDCPALAVLGRQVFLDKQNNVLAIIHIECFKCLIGIDYGYMRGGKVYYAPLHERKINYGMFQSEQYARIVYDIMKKELPDEIEQLDRFIRKSSMKMSLEEITFGGIASEGEKKNQGQESGTRNK